MSHPTNIAIALLLAVAAWTTPAAAADEPGGAGTEDPSTLELGLALPFCAWIDEPGVEDTGGIDCGIFGVGGRLAYLTSLARWLAIGFFVEAGFPLIGIAGLKLRAYLWQRYLYLDLDGFGGYDLPSFEVQPQADHDSFPAVFGFGGAAGGRIPLNEKVGLVVQLQAPVFWGRSGGVAFATGYLRVFAGLSINLAPGD